MKAFRVVLLLAVLSCSVSACGDNTPVDPEPVTQGYPSSLNILFIGSSYFNFNDLPQMVAALSEQTEKDISISTTIQSGLYLGDHAGMSSTAAKIKEKQWDYVILQGVGSLMAYPEYYTYHPVLPALETLRNKIRENSDSTKIVYCMPWAYEDGMIWLSGWTDTYTDMQQKIYDRTLNYANGLGLIVAPVGWAFNTVLSEKNFPLHYLHLDDWNHPSLKGSYLMACVIYSTIFQESTAGIEYHAGLSADDAAYFQQTASATVLDNLELWNIR